jgi:hypothetical protein
MERKRAQNMRDVPQLGPEVYIDDEHDIARQAPPPVSPFSPFLSPLDTEDPRQASIPHAWDGGRRRRGTETSIVGTPIALIGPSFPSGPSSKPSSRPSPKQSHKTSHSAFSFDTGELGDVNELGEASGQHRRGGSAAENVLEVLDNSAWGASIRRSFTLRRPSPGGGPQ